MVPRARSGPGPVSIVSNRLLCVVSALAGLVQVLYALCSGYKGPRSSGNDAAADERNEGAHGFNFAPHVVVVRVGSGRVKGLRVAVCSRNRGVYAAAGGIAGWAT